MTKSLIPHAFGTSSIGQVRKRNEDYHLIDSELRLYIVCDGVGSEPGGDIASKMAAESFRSSLREMVKSFKTITVLEVEALLADAASASSKAVYDHARQNPQYLGMATTLDALWILGDRAFIVHVGDGSIYQYQSKQLDHLTLEHSFKTYLMQTTGCSPEEAMKSPFANSLERAIGLQPFIKADINNYELEEGDVFLLCSDGITKYFNGKELEEKIVGYQKKLEELPEVLTSTCNSRGGRDNSTVIIVSIDRDPAAATASQAQKKAPTRQQKEERMYQVAFFKTLSRPDISKILGISRYSIVPTGTLIMKEGEVPEFFCVLVSGTVEILKKAPASKAGNETVAITESGPGTCLGEGSIFQKPRRTSTVKAKGQVEVLSFLKGDFNLLMEREPILASRVYKAIGSILMDRLASLTNKAAEGKL